VDDAIDKRRGSICRGTGSVFETGYFTTALPLDDFWPGIHLAPCFFAGLGGTVLEVVGKDTQSVQAK
jgi:hypothetical protein